MKMCLKIPGVGLLNWEDVESVKNRDEECEFYGVIIRMRSGDKIEVKYDKINFPYHDIEEFYNHFIQPPAQPQQPQKLQNIQQPRIPLPLELIAQGAEPTQTDDNFDAKSEFQKYFKEKEKVEA